METILIGFIGGVLGGLIVNIVSINYQNNELKKAEEEKSRIEYKRDLKAKLNEIIDFWNKELAKDHIRQTEIQNEFNLYSKQLTSIISKAPDDFSRDTIEELKELSTSLIKIKDLLIVAGNKEPFKKECQEIIEKAEVIRERL